MADSYIYAPACTNFATIGECGRLCPTRLTFEPSAGSLPELTMEHPIDALGRFALLREGWIIKTEVPVRMAPELDGGAYATSVVSTTVSDTATKAQRYIYSRRSGGYRKKLMKVGDEVTVTAKPQDSERWAVRTGRVSGWMESEGLTEVTTVVIPATPSGIESALPSLQLKEQLFRIYAVKTGSRQITAYARGIAADAMYNITTYDTDGEVTLQAALDGVTGACLDSCALIAKTDIQGSRVGVHARDINPISAMLNPEDGLLERWGAQLVVDDHELYFLARAGVDRGVRIEYGKGLTGVDIDVNTEDVCTHIRPVGRARNGERLYLETADGLMACENAGAYQFKRIHVLDVQDAQVDSSVTVQIARARMAAAAQALIDSGVDAPQVSAKISFVSLGDSPRYAQYRNLQAFYIYDAVHVWHPVLRVDMTTQVVRLKWDCILERMEDIELGSVASRMPAVPSWSLPNNINGAKLSAGTVGAMQLSADAVSARHIQAESVNAGAINADSLTADSAAVQVLCAHALQAVTAHIGALTAGTITTDSLVASIAHMLDLTAANITAQGIRTDALAAQLADIAVLCAGTGSFDRATVGHLVAQAMNLEFGVGDTVSITNLRVAYAQMAQAAIGNLCVRASDGNYYEIDVGADGTVTATQATVTDGEIGAGQTSGGRVILDTDITAANLSTANLLATYALVNRIDAARIDVDELAARQAFIDVLNTNLIQGNDIIRLIAQAAADRPQATADDAKAVTDELTRYLEFIRGEGLRQHVPLEDSTYSTLVDETGFHIEQLRQKIASFYKRKLVVENVSVGRLNAESRIALRGSADGGLIFDVEDVWAEINGEVGSAIVGSAITM